ncbi:hypothetical protein [Pediococcus claussenii]|uniref:Uncharacterized protein n=1 Tax=Pediococcus claussenii (strain ATCC BAA-344 / DSM 14800 / JCM 18046 / KCTC 3811 / LMG 21948 / P06) TaxID=701521 RepID=G8PBP1_PEDCP|nr:hypothetical protein [Pediococcus claussenii]AEV94790.1 hypothetical protein PECL_488 [Pediococcus claussenii ATCC BAA-344]ANZ69986.1 hypothetical protein AYR57_06515 [Pediococcus claussenii]ANZ71802.1 hypothetical protein AYR58_06515 [Pediococcus claussenii]KRN20969.1 hypothetical protein IV79_GL000194 [Pediococcus claussenii]
MEKNFEKFLKLRTVLSELPTVRQPISETFDEKRVEREEKKLDKMTKTREFLKRPNEFKRYYHELTELIVRIQVTMFNRDIKDWTPESLADAMTEVIPLLDIAKKWDVLDQLDDVMADIIYFITGQHLVKHGEREFTDDYFKIMSERRMSINYDFGSENFLKHQFKSDPIQLSQDDSDLLFVGGINSELLDNLEEFLSEQSKTDNSLQMQITYALLTERPRNLMDAFFATDYEDIEETTIIYQSLFERYVGIMNVETFIDMSKVIHKLAKFLNRQGWVDDTKYQELLKQGNQLLFYMSKLSEKFTSNSLDRIETKVFNGPNYTINASNARKYLSKPGITLINTKLHPNEKFKLKNVLDDHQLDLEIAQFRKNMDSFLTIRISDPNLIFDKELFCEVILNIHKQMVRKYNRRLSKWTTRSLTDCLRQIYAEINILDEKPLFLRFFDIYLQYLNEIGKIKDYGTLHRALMNSRTDYFVNTIRRLSSKKT